MRFSAIVLFFIASLAFTGCTDKYPNPSADMHASKVRALCETTPPITINRSVSSKGLLFQGTQALSDPEQELLKRRLSFLEINSHSLYPTFTSEDRDELKKRGVTRYYFADIASDECKEFNARARQNPFVLIPFRRLGLPENLCIAKKSNVSPESNYFYYHLYKMSSAPSGQDVHHGLVLADFNTLEIIAETKGFQYCDQPMCWHGFACWRDAEKKKIQEMVTGIPDDRLGPIPAIDTLPEKSFAENREAKLFLVRSTDPESKKLPESASGNSNNTTNSNATIYITEVYEAREPKGSFSLVGYALEQVSKGRVFRTHIKVSDSEVENPSTLRVNNEEITFVASPIHSGFRDLNELFFRYSRSGDPLSLIKPVFVDFARDSSHKYYFDEAKYENGRLRLVLLEAVIDEHHEITVLKKHEFQELLHANRR